MSARIWNVLFICTGNSARSIMAEGLVNCMGKGRFRAYSAGSKPVGRVNPLAIAQLQGAGCDTAGLRSKSWDEFATPDAPLMDFIITVCDNAAGEVCPVWPGHPVSAHWGFEDPAAVQGTDADKHHAFSKVFRQIGNRVQLFTHLPLERLEHTAIHQELRAIGQTPA